jgi:hypothetical protein
VTTNSSTTHTSPVEPAGRADQPWTAQRIRALGVVTDLPTAAQVFGLGRSLAYQLARDGQFPTPVIRVGSRYRVAVAAILTALHIPDTEPDIGPAAPGEQGTGTDPGSDLIVAPKSSVDHTDPIRCSDPHRVRAVPNQGAP